MTYCFIIQTFTNIHKSNRLPQLKDDQLNKFIDSFILINAKISLFSSSTFCKIKCTCTLLVSRTNGPCSWF